MADKEEIRQSLKRFLANPSSTYSKVCTVIAVSAGTTDGLMLCDCQPIDDTPIIEDVRLVANFDDTTTNAGFICVPKIDSFVIVTFLNPSTAFVSMVSEIDVLYANGNTYGGLVKVADLVTRLNIIENKINAFITWGLTVTPAFPVATPLTPTVNANIENPNVKHGDGSLI